MKHMITLRQFIEIAPNIVQTYLCQIYILVIDKKWGYEKYVFAKDIKHINDLNDFLDAYYIARFDQEVVYGEIEHQRIYLNPIESTDVLTYAIEDGKIINE